MDWSKKLFTNKVLYLSIVAVVLSGVLALYTFDRWIMPAYTNYNEALTVPDVTKISLQEAETRLELYGLRYEIADRRTHSAYPADYIIDQAPSPRQLVKPNRKVYLTVNTVTRPTVVVPRLVDMSLRNARIQLENYGLELGSISHESARFRNVIRQSIAPGDTVDQGAVVDLTIGDGLGGEIVRVPEIEGLLLPEAQQKLREEGLRIGDVRFEPSRDVIPNTVLSRSPAGDELREGVSLNLVVSEHFDAREEDEAGAVVDDDEPPAPRPDDPDEMEENDDNQDDDNRE